MESTVKKVFEYKQETNGMGPVVFNWSQDF